MILGVDSFDIRWQNALHGALNLLVFYWLKVAHRLGLVMLAGQREGADWTAADLCTYLFDALAALILDVIFLMYDTQSRPLNNLMQLFIINRPVENVYR